jgi:hypothetical protein
MHETELRLIEQILDETKDKTRCVHFIEKDRKCGLTNEVLGLHEMQLWCLDGERCSNCIFYKQMEFSNDQLNDMTLDVAELLAKKYKIEGFQWSPCLDFLKSGISRAIEFNSYLVPRSQYVDWIALKKRRNK